MRRGNLYWHIKQFPFSTFFSSDIPPDSLCNNNADRNTKQKRITTKWLRTKVILKEYKACRKCMQYFIGVWEIAILTSRCIPVLSWACLLQSSIDFVLLDILCWWHDYILYKYIGTLLLLEYCTANTENYFRTKRKSINKTT